MAPASTSFASACVGTPKPGTPPVSAQDPFADLKKQITQLGGTSKDYKSDKFQGVDASFKFKTLEEMQTQINTVLGINRSLSQPTGSTGASGSRTIAIDDFFKGLFQTALTSEEILTEVQVPTPKTHSGGAYVKLERKVGDFATAGVAVQLNLDDAGKIEQIGIGLTNVGLMAIRAKYAKERPLAGVRVTDSFFTHMTLRW